MMCNQQLKPYVVRVIALSFMRENNEYYSIICKRSCILFNFPRIFDPFFIRFVLFIWFSLVWNFFICFFYYFYIYIQLFRDEIIYASNVLSNDYAQTASDGRCITYSCAWNCSKAS